jgi:hypothetical protein
MPLGLGIEHTDLQSPKNILQSSSPIFETPPQGTIDHFLADLETYGLQVSGQPQTEVIVDRLSGQPVSSADGTPSCTYHISHPRVKDLKKLASLEVEVDLGIGERRTNYRHNTDDTKVYRWVRYVCFWNCKPIKTPQPDSAFVSKTQTKAKQTSKTIRKQQTKKNSYTLGKSQSKEEAWFDLLEAGDGREAWFDLLEAEVATARP